MRYLNAEERHQVVGPYYAPEGYYEYTKTLPFLGTVKSEAKRLVGGQWTEIIIVYEVGASGLADGAWIKGTFKFYSDWALFQTSDPAKDNHVSVEYVPKTLLPGQDPATVQSLGVRFDQKGHERPFQKAVIIDVHDGYLNPGDQIVIRLGDRRFGARGTRVQTFVESDFRWRFYIDPVGTSRFAPIKPDLSWNIVPGTPAKVKTTSPRLVKTGALFAVHAHVEDVWGNVTRDISGLTWHLEIQEQGANGDGQVLVRKETTAPVEGWTNSIFSDITIGKDGDYLIKAILKSATSTITSQSHLTVSSDLSISRVLFGDLHVHSDDTVGTESSVYNFSYGREIAGLDVLGYTANDFQITKARWDATLNLIKSLNKPGQFVIFPGTEWCGNSAAGGDHNVVFLADPQTNPPEFPFDRYGNVARSFEWSEDGPQDLVPGAWPLDEVYATYAHATESHLLIPHVGGRRCNVAWHHPQLERLVEIGSAWGQFEWLLQDAVRRGWKLGVCANSDEHRGRCGGGVPGTAVFGTRGGLTGIITPELERSHVAGALRERHTFATTGQRLVGLVSSNSGTAIQGDELSWPADSPLDLKYHFLGEKGFASIEAFDASGQVWQRNLWTENDKTPTILRVTWGGARLYDRYREAFWNGEIEIIGNSPSISNIEPFGGFEDNPEDRVVQSGNQTVTFHSHTSGDINGAHVTFNPETPLPSHVLIKGTIDGYVKVGDPLAGNPHKPQPNFQLEASWDKITASGGKSIEILGGCELFVRVEAIPNTPLPVHVQGSAFFTGKQGEERAIYFVGREWSGGKAVTSPVFVAFF